MPRLTFPALLRSGRPLVGTWSQIASEECVDLLGSAGFDFSVIDCEHGAFGIETAERLCRACDANGIASLVRAPGADPGFIGRALDAGASAVVVPGVASAEAAAQAVQSARYAPEGTRGACPCIRAAGQRTTDWRAHSRAQALDTGIVALVESPEGVAAIEAIVRVPGLLAVMAGPFDLSVAMGLEGDFQHPEVVAAIDRLVQAAVAAGLPVIVPIFDPDPAQARAQQQAWLARGVRVFMIGTDKLIFADAARRHAQALR